MNVVLLTHTPCAEELIYAAMRTCYSTKDTQELFAAAIAGSTETRELIREVVASGHVSPVEHVTFTFAVSGVSRSLTHQLVRHRIASYSQQSQRYVTNKDVFDFITPPTVSSQMERELVFQEAMKAAQFAYDSLVRAGVPAEDARYVLPNAAATRIVITMNCRGLLNFFAERCCRRAQWEIREMARRMLKTCSQVLPVVFEGAGAKCRKKGFCPETEKFTCGKYPPKMADNPNQ